MGRLSRIIGGGGGPRVGCNHEGPFKKRAKGGLLQKEDRVDKAMKPCALNLEEGATSQRKQILLSASRTMRINLRCFKILKVYHALSQWQQQTKLYVPSHEIQINLSSPELFPFLASPPGSPKLVSFYSSEVHVQHPLF